jgi:hypothetical protein
MSFGAEIDPPTSSPGVKIPRNSHWRQDVRNSLSIEDGWITETQRKANLSSPEVVRVSRIYLVLWDNTKAFGAFLVNHMVRSVVKEKLVLEYPGCNDNISPTVDWRAKKLATCTAGLKEHFTKDTGC